MPRTDKRPLAEINIQTPGKITQIKELEIKNIPEKKLKIVKTFISLAGEIK